MRVTVDVATSEPTAVKHTESDKTATRPDGGK